MKQIFKLLLPLSSAAIVAPVVMTTSCVPIYNESMYELSFNNGKVATSLQECNKLNMSLEDLICGTKKFHSGNYMIILGSECSKQSNNLFGLIEFSKYFSAYSFFNKFLIFEKTELILSSLFILISCLFEFNTTFVFFDG